MHLEYYGLDKDPFSISPDPAFLWFGPKHQEAFALLRYGILEERGFLCLTGEVGTGKTALVRNLINTIEVPAIIVSVPDPDMKPYDFFRYVASEIRLPGKFRDKGDFLIKFKSHVMQAYGDNTRVLIIIDEAQRLNFALLEQIRLMSNMVSTARRQLNVFLVGQNELNGLLSDERAKATRDRIVVRHTLAPLNEDETNAYVLHRLQVAGADRVIFLPEAIDAVARHTDGIPRAINVLCDQALVAGHEKGAMVIDAEIIDRCPVALELPQPPPEKDGRESPNRGAVKEKSRRLTSAEAVPGGKRSWVTAKNAAILAVVAMLAGFTGYQLFLSAGGVSDHRRAQEGVLKMEAAAPVQPEKVKKDAGRDAPSPAVREEGTTPPPKANAEGAKAEPRSKSGPKTTPPVPDPRNGKKGNAGESKRPALAGGRGTSVDDSGGRTGPVSLRAASKLILYFGFDSTHLTAKSAGDLRDYLARITPVANASFQVNGYTDSVGDFWYNMKLSQRRAEAVRELMIESGIRPASIVAVGKGSAESTAENDLRQHRQDSRKVEVVLTVSR